MQVLRKGKWEGIIQSWQTHPQLILHWDNVLFKFYRTEEIIHVGLDEEQIAQTHCSRGEVLKNYVFGDQHGLETSRNAAGQEREYLNPTYIYVTLQQSTTILTFMISWLFITSLLPTS